MSENITPAEHLAEVEILEVRAIDVVDGHAWLRMTTRVGRIGNRGRRGGRVSVSGSRSD